MRTTLLTALAGLLLSGVAGAQEKAAPRWQIADDGAIVWRIDERIPHYDHIEMSGESLSAVLRYGVNGDGSFSMERSIVWPMLRTVPNNTHASLTRRFATDFLQAVTVDGQTLNGEQVQSIALDGKLTAVSRFTVGHDRDMRQRRSDLRPEIELTRIYAPSTTLPTLCELYVLKNIGSRRLEVCLPAQRIVYATDPARGVQGSYTLIAKTDHTESRLAVLNPGEELRFGASVQGVAGHQEEQSPIIEEELAERDALRRELRSKLVLECPDSVIVAEFEFAKLRAAESIFRTKGGLMHSPGGEAYYAAMWANDQAEYVSPLFPFLGYAKGNESALNCFRHYSRFINDRAEALPSSIIAEGDDHFGVAGDRGDCAMVAYGAARTILALGSESTAAELWPLVRFSLEYCHSKLNDKGVVASDSDELENRFPSGDANLCTSTLYYDALLSASYIAEQLGERRTAALYRTRADRLKECISAHFSACVEGYDTYRYYDGNDVLRSWICMPLVVGITDRAAGTVEALLSPRLMTPDGLLTQSGTRTFWDRSTLYALRGIFATGETEKATAFLEHYAATRLLGEHVPYPIEAWPEGNQRHLSAESGLFCRIFTEGIFGIRPTGFSSFELTPRLPEKWDRMALGNIYAFGGAPFDIRVSRRGERLDVRVVREGKIVCRKVIGSGQTVRIALPRE